jgi:hypothetical protein
MVKRKRIALILGCLAAVLLAGYGTLRLTASRHRITMRNVSAIDFGKEVEGILGVSAGDYTTRDHLDWYMQEKTETKNGLPGGIPCQSGVFLAKEPGGKFWKGNETSVWIRFDETGKVREIWSSIFPNEDGSFFGKLRRWLGM